MTRIIQLDVNSIQNIIAEMITDTISNITSQDPVENRKHQIQVLKTAIYQYRNQLLSKILATDISNTSFLKTEYGKPYLQHYPKFYINHSHSQKYYALASSAQMQDIGVDIEDLDRKVRFEALAKHAFHPDELQTWRDLDCDQSFWFKVWTTKEAILKASGLGIRLSLNDLNTNVHPIHDGGICSHPQLGHFAYQNFNLGYAMLTVAWRSELSCKGFAFPNIQIVKHD